jgi:serine/threonine protein kinase
VLTDFGQSRKLVEESGASKNAQMSSRMRSLVGTRGYAAP